MKTILGREPAVIVGLIEGILAVVVSLNLGLSAGMSALVVAVVTATGGLVTGWATVDTRLGLITGLAKSVLALAIGFGLTLTPEQQGPLLALIPLIFAAWQRTQTSPAGFPPAAAAATPVVVVNSAVMDPQAVEDQVDRTLRTHEHPASCSPGATRTWSSGTGDRLPCFQTT